MVTETLWALVADPGRAEAERFVPDEVHVLTTAAGYANAKEALFSPGRAYRRLLPGARHSTVSGARAPGRPWGCVVRRRARPRGQLPLCRCRAAARAGVRGPRRLPHPRLHGRGPQDHELLRGDGADPVRSPAGPALARLVPGFYEGCPDFWWPANPPFEVEHRFTRERRSTADARVELVEVPFLRLRAYLPETLIPADQGYREWVSAIQAALEEPVGVLDDATQTLSIGGHRIHIREPQQYALYRYLVATRVERRPGAGPDGVGDERFGWVRPGAELAEWRSERAPALRPHPGRGLGAEEAGCGAGEDRGLRGDRRVRDPARGPGRQAAGVEAGPGARAVQAPAHRSAPARGVPAAVPRARTVLALGGAGPAIEAPDRRLPRWPATLRMVIGGRRNGNLRGMNAISGPISGFQGGRDRIT